MNLLEKYSKRLAVADKYFSDNHGGERLSESKKLTTAVCLDNIDKVLNESFNNSIGTQRADLGLFKKFCINLTNVALPSLIANDIVITKPRTSMKGVVAYIKYTAGSNKGMTKQGDLINSPFQHGKVDVDYTSAQIVTEAKTTDATGTLRWVEVVPGTVEFIVTVLRLLLMTVQVNFSLLERLMQVRLIIRLVHTLFKRSLQHLALQTMFTTM